jgi:hypothetical protein
MIEYEKIFNNGLKLEVEDNGFVVRDDDNFIIIDASSIADWRFTHQIEKLKKNQLKG